LKKIFRTTVSPTYPQSELTLNLDDYGKKRSIRLRLSGAGFVGDTVWPLII
jgi:hypothetical protein